MSKKRDPERVAVGYIHAGPETEGSSQQITETHPSGPYPADAGQADQDRVLGPTDPTRNTADHLARVSPTFVRSDTQRMFEHWAGLLRERLDVFTGK